MVLFAAGNGNESVSNDGYASYQNVVAVAACNDSGVKAPTAISARPSGARFPGIHGEASKTTGIWTTDRSGRLGCNPGSEARGDIAGNYLNSIGGT